MTSGWAEAHFEIWIYKNSAYLNIVCVWIMARLCKRDFTFQAFGCGHTELRQFEGVWSWGRGFCTDMGHSGFKQLIKSHFGFGLSFSFLHSVALKHEVHRKEAAQTLWGLRLRWGFVALCFRGWGVRRLSSDLCMTVGAAVVLPVRWAWAWGSAGLTRGLQAWHRILGVLPAMCQAKDSENSRVIAADPVTSLTYLPSVQ